MDSSGQIGNNAEPLVRQLQQTLAARRDLQTAAQRVAPLAAARVTISVAGGQAGKLDATLQKIDDPAERERAQQGLRAVVDALGSESGALLDLAVQLDQLGAGDPDVLTRFFVAADAVDRADLDVSGFARGFAAVDDAALGGRLADQARDVAQLPGFPDLRERTFDGLLREVKGAASKSGSGRTAALDRLFDQLEYEDTLADKDAVLAERVES